MMDVLLVDDEPWVLEGLRTMVNWDKYGFRICGEAENGNVAWSMIEGLQPDLVFTDIHMPSVSGLELIDTSLNGLSNPPRFVILSGYDSFEYAKTALEARVEDYLLKPIDEDEIEKVLEQIARKIHKEHALKEMHRRERALYVNCVFNRLLHGEDSSELRMEVEAMLPIEDHENMSCLLIEGGAGIEDMKSWICGMAEAHWSEPFSDAEGRIGIFTSEAEHSLERLEAMGRSLCEVRSNSPILVALGHHPGGISALRPAYEKALSALNWKRYQDVDGIIYYENLPQNKGQVSVNQQALTALIETILSGEQDRLRDKLHAMLAYSDSALSVPDIEHVRVQLLALEMSIRKHLKELDGDVDRLMADVQNMSGVITRTSSYVEARDYAFMLSLTAMNVMQELRNKKESNTIYRVIQYVNQEFREKVQLQELAQKFHMNANYLGQAFKQQTGKSFREYLNDKRMDEAKRLLRQSRCSISEVALNSGYSNTDYFISQFKRSTGMAPSVYRKQPT